MSECTLREVEALTCATLAMRGPFDQMPQAFGTVYGWIARQGHEPRGMPMAVYLDDPAQVDPADARWEVWAPIEADAAQSPPDERGLGIRHVPAMTVASTVHRGPYEQVAAAYERLVAWVAERGLTVCGPPREAYLNDPSGLPPEEYLTEVMLPVR